jgi:hypothetical protein
MKITKGMSAGSLLNICEKLTQTDVVSSTVAEGRADSILLAGRCNPMRDVITAFKLNLGSMLVEESPSHVAVLALLKVMF